jgi:hypothetical protein
MNMTRHANILDEIHSELSPLVFDNPAADRPILKPKHAHWIKKEIYATLDEGGYTNVVDWLSLVLTGSICTYQYSNESDIDVSLFIDSRIFPEWSRAELIALMVEKMDGRMLPGTQFPMQDFVVGEGIKPSDLYKPGLRSAYNIDNGKWIVPPERNRVYDIAAEEGGFYAYALQQADKMQTLLKYEPEKAVQLWHQIHKKRQRDMRAGKGDAAESNLVYKFLFKRGLIPQISEYSGEYIAKKAPQPPNYKVGTLGKHCSNCKMYDHGQCWGYGNKKVKAEWVCDSWTADRQSKTAARVLYNKFSPDPVHPRGENKEPILPFIYDPQEDVVHLGPANAWHWQLLQKTPELRDAYEGEWDQPAWQATDLKHVHGNMEWPSKNITFFNGEPEQQEEIIQALGGQRTKRTWNFQARVDLNQIAQRIYEGVTNGTGSTLNLHGESPHTRYGFAPDLATQTPISLETFSPKDVLDFIGRFSDRLADPEKFVGAWIQGDQVILDVSEGHDDFDTAYQRAWNGHQKAMYDSQAHEDVPVRGLDYEQPLTS